MAISTACESLIASLSSLTADEKVRASAALLPGLAARLDDLLRGEADGRSSTSTAVTSVCHALAALSDHADAPALSRLGRNGVASQLGALLRDCVESPAQRAWAEATLAYALWFLGNVAADQDAAAAFAATGGVRLLVSLLAPTSSVTTPDVALHVCVALASVSAHKDGAAALLDSGALGHLSRVISALDLRGTSTATVPQGSLADAEAACRAVANVLQHFSATEGCNFPGSALEACRELAASEMVAGCTTVLRWHAAAVGPLHESHMPMGPLASHAAEALLFAVRCARRAEAEAGEGAACILSALAGQAVEAGAEAAVSILRQGTLSSSFAGGGDSDPDSAAQSGESLDPPLQALALALAGELGLWLRDTALREASSS